MQPHISTTTSRPVAEPRALNDQLWGLDNDICGWTPISDGCTSQVNTGGKGGSFALSYPAVRTWRDKNRCVVFSGRTLQADKRSRLGQGMLRA